MAEGHGFLATTTQRAKTMAQMKIRGVGRLRVAT